MEANEAIDIVEELQKHTKQGMKEEIKKFVDNPDYTMEDVMKQHYEIERAQEIVLESSKVLHELIEQEGIDSLDDERYPNAHRIYIDDEGVLTIKSDVLKKIGVDLE